MSKKKGVSEVTIPFLEGDGRTYVDERIGFSEGKYIWYIYRERSNDVMELIEFKDLERLTKIHVRGLVRKDARKHPKQDKYRDVRKLRHELELDYLLKIDNIWTETRRQEIVDEVKKRPYD